VSNAGVDAQSIVSKASAIIPYLRGRADEIDAAGRLPDDVVQALHDVGAYRMTEPPTSGTDDFEPVRLSDLCGVILEVAKGNGSAAWSVLINLGPYFLPAYGDDVLREVLTPPHVGPRIAGTIFQARAKAEGRLVENGYLIKGSWGYPSNVWHCAWLFGGFKYTDADGAAQWGMALMPRADFEIADDWLVEGLKGSGSNTAYTDAEVFVPSERVVLLNDFVGKVDHIALVAGHLGVSAMIVGCAHGALDSFLEVAPKRAGWGGALTIASMPTTQTTVAKVRAQIGLAELALRNAAAEHDEAARTGSAISEHHAALLAYENVHVAHQVRHAVEELAVTVGSSAALEADPLTRFIRDLRVACLHGLVRLEPQAEKYGRSLLGVEDVGGPNLS
jgi:alkylation response protein AidB-like acyl-CoA dehydrogenase